MTRGLKGRYQSPTIMGVVIMIEQRLCVLIWVAICLAQVPMFYSCPEPAEPGIVCKCMAATSLWCHVEFDFTYMPEFKASTEQLEDLVIAPLSIGKSGTVLEIQANALHGIKTRRVAFQYLEIERLQAGAFQALGALVDRLELSGNEISTIDADAFLGIPNIYYIDLSGNRLQAIPSGIFKGLNQLKTLYLQDNRISAIAPDAFEGLNSLESLYLGDNRLQRVGMEISYLPRLKMLYLYGNGGLNGLPFQFDDVALLGLGNLQILDVSRCSLTRPPVEQFHYIKNLTTLNIASNQMEAIVFYAFSGVKMLQELDLSSNLLRQVPTAALQPLTELRLLDLRYNKLSRTDTNAFMGLVSLRTLELSNNDIYSFANNAFESLYNLEILKISSNSLETLNFETFQCLKNLKEIMLNSNAFACDCDLAWLRIYAESYKVDIIGNKMCENPIEYQSNDILSFPIHFCPSTDFNIKCHEPTVVITTSHNKNVTKGTDIKKKQQPVTSSATKRSPVYMNHCNLVTILLISCLCKYFLEL